MMPRITQDKLMELIRKANNDKDIFLAETSYNRIRSHIEGGNAFAIITSDRHERSNKENRKMYKQLKQNFKAANFPFTEVKGGFKETTKTKVDPETGQEYEIALEEPIYVTENSILITTHYRPDAKKENTAENLLDFTAEMARKYNQEAFIFGEPAMTTSGRQIKNINAYDKGGNVIEQSWAGPWNSVETVTVDEDFWSRVKGKHFQLKETEKKKTSQPKSWIEAMKKSRSGETW